MVIDEFEMPVVKTAVPLLEGLEIVVKNALLGAEVVEFETGILEVMRVRVVETCGKVELLDATDDTIVELE